MLHVVRNLAAGYRPERVAQTSAGLTAETLTALKDLLPQAFTEGKIDFEKLRRLLGDDVTADGNR